MKSRIPAFQLVAALAVVVLPACDRTPAGLPGPDTDLIAYGKGGGSGSLDLFADVVTGDFVQPPGDKGALLTSDCPGVVSQAGWHMDWAHSQCMIVQPNWNTATDTAYTPYPLTDDIFVAVRLVKNKGTSYITEIKLTGQDVIGEAGIHHDTDWLQVIPATVPSKNGYVLHVHAPDVGVWRHDSHGVGNRVALIGWISIGDIVVRKQ